MNFEDFDKIQQISHLQSLFGFIQSERRLPEKIEIINKGTGSDRCKNHPDAKPREI